MPRMARLVVPGLPHHITQGGSRRQLIFFEDADYRAYLSLIQRFKAAAGVDIWAYCFLPNHVHFVAVPARADSLAKLLRVVQHRYARRINEARGWCGHLWQEHFHSFVMDEPHLLAAVRYVEQNPVRSGLCERADGWPWSSIHAHYKGVSDGIVNVAPMLERTGDWRAYVETEIPPKTMQTLRGHTSTGRPAGNENFVARLERMTGRTLRKRRPGPRPGS